MSILSKAINRSEDRVRSFVFSPQSAEAKPMRVTVRYRAQAEIQEKVDEEKTRILSRPRAVEIQDVFANSKELEQLVNKLFADNVVKIESNEFVMDEATGEPVKPPQRKPVTWGHLRTLVNLSITQVAKEGGLDATLPFDPTQFKKGSAEEKAARDHILDLIENSPEFRTWIQGVVSDLAYFQDGEWEASIKNSVVAPAKKAGATSNSEKASQASPETAVAA